MLVWLCVYISKVHKVDAKFTSNHMCVFIKRSFSEYIEYFYLYFMYVCKLYRDSYY